MLTRLEGVWLGDLNGKRIVIIDPAIADHSTMKIIDDLINERRDNGRRDDERRTSILVQQEHEYDVQV